MKEFTEEEQLAIREAQRQYNRDYYAKNKKRILEQNKQWRNENPEKVKQAVMKSWLKKIESQPNLTE